MTSAFTRRSARNLYSLYLGSGQRKYFHQGYSPPKPQGHFCTYTTRSPISLRLSFIFFSRESTTVKTATMAKIPTVTPNKERVVRRIFDFNACQAKRKLSIICRIITIVLVVT